jgi:hypothetical protein
MRIPKNGGVLVTLHSVEATGRASSQDKSNACREYIVCRPGTDGHDPG